MQVSLDDIRLNTPENIRWDADEQDPDDHIDQGDLDDLKESFKTVVEYNDSNRALIQPITLVRDTSSVHEYKVGAGFRRYVAMSQLREEGYEWAETIEAEVPSEDSETSDVGFHVQALIENVQRKDMPPIMEARAIKKLCDMEDKGQTEIAREIGKSKGWVSQRMGLLDLDNMTQSAVEAGDISVTHARELGRIDDEDTRRQKLDEVIDEDKNSKELKSEIDDYKADEPEYDDTDRETNEPEPEPGTQNDDNVDKSESEPAGNPHDLGSVESGVIEGLYETCEAYERNDKTDENVDTARSYYFHFGCMYMLAYLNGDVDTGVPLKLSKEENEVFGKTVHNLARNLFDG